MPKKIRLIELISIAQTLKEQGGFRFRSDLELALNGIHHAMAETLEMEA